MDNIKILKISEINQAKLINFYKETFDEIRSFENDYKWRYRFTYKESEPLIAIDESKIIGHVGCYPTKFKINEKNMMGFGGQTFLLKKNIGEKVLQS